MLRRLPTCVLLGVLVVGAAFYVWFGVRAVAFPYSLDYGEGPLLDQAVRLAHGFGIYRVPAGAAPWTVSNYPPLYPGVEAALSVVFGPGYWYGRLASLASVVAAAYFAGSIVRMIIEDRIAGLVTALFVLAVPFTGYWAALARIDSLALALSLGGLWCVVRWPTRRLGLVLAVIAFTAAVFTRQTAALAAPLAAFVWLLRIRIGRAFLLAAGVGAAVVALGAGLNLWTRGAFWFDVVTANVNAYDWGTVASYGGYLVTHLPVLLAAALAAIVVSLALRVRGTRLLVAYLLGSFAVGLTSGKVGSNVNYLMEFGVALSIAAGMLLGCVRPWPRWRLVTVVLLTVQAAILLVPSQWHQMAELRMSTSTANAELLDIVKAADGPVLADEDMGLLPLAGRPIEFQPFELTQLAAAGSWDQQPVVDAIYAQRYAVILVFSFPDFAVEQERWTPEMLGAIAAAYEPATEVDTAYGKTVVYRPIR